MAVVETGMFTEMGRLSKLLAATTDGPSPLQIQLDILGKRLTVIAATMVGMLFLLKWLRGEALTSIILDSIALTIASMPEGLPHRGNRNVGSGNASDGEESCHRQALGQRGNPWMHNRGLF